MSLNVTQFLRKFKHLIAYYNNKKDIKRYSGEWYLMKETESNDNKDVEKRINKLRLKLNKVYETQGHTEEVVKLSQELDKYILSAQQEVLEKPKKDKV